MLNASMITPNKKPIAKYADLVSLKNRILFFRHVDGDILLPGLLAILYAIRFLAIFRFIFDNFDEPFAE